MSNALVMNSSSILTHPFLFPVRLVADENLGDAFTCMLLNVGVPCANVCREDCRRDQHGRGAELYKLK